jgi:hypothetical protein
VLVVGKHQKINYIPTCLSRVVVLVLTLSVLTATTEQTFSIMNIVKAMFRNKIDQDESLSNSFTSYIKREIVAKFSTYLIIDDFRDLKE